MEFRSVLNARTYFVLQNASVDSNKNLHVTPICLMQPFPSIRLIRPYTLGRCSGGVRISSAYARFELRPQFRSLATLLSTSTSTFKQHHHMGGGPELPTRSSASSFSIMHRAPAAMVTKPMVDPDIEIRTPRDPNTLSNYHNYVTRHTSVDFEIDFEKKRLVGKAILKMESLTDEAVEVTLDSRYDLLKAVSTHAAPLHEHLNYRDGNSMTGHD